MDENKEEEEKPQLVIDVLKQTVTTNSDYSDSLDMLNNLVKEEQDIENSDKVD